MAERLNGKVAIVTGGSRGMSISPAEELRGTDIRVYVVCSGAVDTGMVGSARPDIKKDDLIGPGEITDLVKAGDNLLEVTVSKVSSDRSVEEAERQADYWVFGGIYRPVDLEVMPKQFIEWIAVDARSNGTFRADVHLNETGDADSVKAEIIGLNQAFEEKRGPDRAKVTLQTQVQRLVCSPDIPIVNGTPELFLGVCRPNDGPFPANTKLNVLETGIALLHGIRAIGTKFDKPEVLRLQSERNKAAGTYRGTVWFHFGD